MTRIESLRNRWELLSANDAILKAADSAHRGLTASEKASIVANLHAVDRIDEAHGLGPASALAADPEAASRIAYAAVEAGERDLQRAPYVPNPDTVTVELAMDGSGPRVLSNSFGNPRIGGRFTELFGSTSRDNFRDLEDYLSAVHRNDTARLRAATFNETTPSSGGFSVPTEFAAWLLDGSLEDEVMRPGATVWPMTSSDKLIPAWDGNDHTAGLFGGLAATWEAELSTATDLAGSLRQIALKAKKLLCYTAASNELAADGVGFEYQLGTALRRTLGWYLDYAFLQGNGAGKPLGVLNDPALITVAKETGQGADTILWENLVNMYSRLHPACAKRAVWVANTSTLPQLMQLTLGVGTGGVYFQVLKEASGTFSIMGRPVLFTEKLPALGDAGDIVLVDRSQYAIGLRKDMSLDKSNAPGWHEDKSSYRAIVRVDGMGTWNAPVTPKHGDTLSWCVTLAAR